MNIYRFKSRLVPTGNQQGEGIDYNETFAPVGDKIILRLTLILTLVIGFPYSNSTLIPLIYMDSFKK
jgi:hypothetical protein